MKQMKIHRVELPMHRVLAAVTVFFCTALLALPAAAQVGRRGRGNDAGPAAVACDLQSLAAGLNRNCSIDVSGTRRVFDVLVPMNVTRNAPITLDFHAQGDTKEQQRAQSGLQRLVEQDGLVVIYPQGIDRTFNGQTCCGTAAERAVNDVGFARAAMEAVVASLGIQPAVRAASGRGNGMALGNRLACEAGDFFDLVAGVSFQIAAQGGTSGLGDVCHPIIGTIYEEFHATADEIVPFAGATGGEEISVMLQTLPADQVARSFGQIRGCNLAPEQTELNSNTVCQRFANCQGGGAVGMCTVRPGAHRIYPLIGSGDEPDFADRFSALLREATALNRRGVLRAGDLTR